MPEKQRSAWWLLTNLSWTTRRPKTNERLVCGSNPTYLNSDERGGAGRGGQKEEIKLLLGLNDLFSKHWYLCECVYIKSYLSDGISGSITSLHLFPPGSDDGKLYSSWTNEATPRVFPTLHIVLCSGETSIVL